MNKVDFLNTLFLKMKQIYVQIIKVFEKRRGRARLCFSLPLIPSRDKIRGQNPTRSRGPRYFLTYNDCQHNDNHRE